MDYRENFRSEWVTTRQSFGQIVVVRHHVLYEIKTVSDLDAVLTDGLAQLQKIIAQWAKRAIDP